MKRLFIVFFFISAGLFGEETGLQVENAGEGGGTFTFYDVVFGSGMIGILIWGLLFATSTAALAITIRAVWSLRKSRFISTGFTEQILPLVESKDYQEAYNVCVGSPALAKKIVREESIGWGNQESNLTNEIFCRRQAGQTRRMARKSINHPSVILHGFMNELKSNIEPAKQLIHTLAGILRDEDPSRLVTYACNIPFEDIALGEVDVISFNIYPGWYINPQMSDMQEFNPVGFEKALLKYETVVNRAEYLDKPYIISEIGGAALPGFHGDIRWGEEYQADLAAAAFSHVLKSSRCSGIALWMFCDTRSFNDCRAPSRPRGFNNKGVVDEYRRPKMAWNSISRLLKKTF